MNNYEYTPLILLYLIIFLRYLKEKKKFFNLKKKLKVNVTFKSNLVKYFIKI